MPGDYHKARHRRKRLVEAGYGVQRLDELRALIGRVLTQVDQRAWLEVSSLVLQGRHATHSTHTRVHADAAATVRSHSPRA